MGAPNTACPETDVGSLQEKIRWQVNPKKASQPFSKMTPRIDRHLSKADPVT
jgi:hypothetical protein